MRIKFWSSMLIPVAGLALLAALPAAAAEGDAAPAKDTRPIPHLPNGKPDLSGVWDHPRVGDFTKGARGCVGNTPGCSATADTKEYPFTPAGKAAFEDPKKFDYGVHCLPWGYVRSWATPYPLELMQKDDRLAVLFEQNKWFHIVPTDGRKLDPDKVTPTWMGTSVGHWEGDTLVVETIGTNGKTWIDTAEHPHSDALTVVERFDRIDYSHIRHQITITDTKFFTKPMTNTAIMSLMKPGDELLEYSCDENNKEVMEGHVHDDFFRTK
ncbi:MAG: hypothetical protein ABSG41_11095 [Bryobacteraceae bacterium]